MRRRIAYASTHTDAPSRQRALTGAPWRPEIADSTFRQLRDAILRQADAAASARGMTAQGCH
jgi:hypothetical protein